MRGIEGLSNGDLTDGADRLVGWPSYPRCRSLPNYWKRVIASLRELEKPAPGKLEGADIVLAKATHVGPMRASLVSFFEPLVPWRVTQSGAQAGLP